MQTVCYPCWMLPPFSVLAGECKGKGELTGTRHLFLNVMGNVIYAGMGRLSGLTHIQHKFGAESGWARGKMNCFPLSLEEAQQSQLVYMDLCHLTGVTDPSCLELCWAAWEWGHDPAQVPETGPIPILPLPTHGFTCCCPPWNDFFSVSSCPPNPTPT